MQNESERGKLSQSGHPGDPEKWKTGGKEIQRKGKGRGMVKVKKKKKTGGPDPEVTLPVGFVVKNKRKSSTQ